MRVYVCDITASGHRDEEMALIAESTRSAHHCERYIHVDSLINRLLCALWPSDEL